MRRTKHVIAVMVVATALCADRSIAAAPVASPTPSPGLARSFASKLTRTLRQTVAPMRLLTARTDETSRPAPLLVREAASGVRTQISPVQFRLPPPSL